MAVWSLDHRSHRSQLSSVRKRIAGTIETRHPTGTERHVEPAWHTEASTQAGGTQKQKAERAASQSGGCVQQATWHAVKQQSYSHRARSLGGIWQEQGSPVH